MNQCTGYPWQPHPCSLPTLGVTGPGELQKINLHMMGFRGKISLLSNSQWLVCGSAWAGSFGTLWGPWRVPPRGDPSPEPPWHTRGWAGARSWARAAAGLCSWAQPCSTWAQPLPNTGTAPAQHGHSLGTAPAQHRLCPCPAQAQGSAPGQVPGSAPGHRAGAAPATAAPLPWGAPEQLECPRKVPGGKLLPEMSGQGTEMPSVSSLL